MNAFLNSYFSRLLKILAKALHKGAACSGSFVTAGSAEGGARKGSSLGSALCGAVSKGVSLLAFLVP